MTKQKNVSERIGKANKIIGRMVIMRKWKDGSGYLEM